MADSTKHRYNYKYYDNTVSTSQLVFSGFGTLHYITVNQTTAATIGVCDIAATTNASANVAQLKASIAEGTYRYDVSVNNGLVIKPSGHLGNITVCYTQG